MEPTKPLPVAEIPSAENLTPAEAGAKLAAIRDAAACDPRHALTFGHHPQHARLVAAVVKLAERYAQRPDAHETPTSRACQTALAEADGRRDALAVAVGEEVESLRRLGFTGEAPHDPQPWNLAVLRAQRLLAEGNLAAATPILENELRELRAPAVLKQQLAQAIHDPDTMPEIRSITLDKVLRWVHVERKRRSGSKPSTEDAQ